MAGNSRVGGSWGERSLLNNYKAAGPRCQEYIQSKAPITLIMGPEGSGKSVGSGAKMIWAARQQLPSPHDNIVRVKGYIIRETYRDLWDKTIPTYWSCLPKDLYGSIWTGGKGEPATHIVKWQEPKKSKDGKILYDAKGKIIFQEYESIHEFRAVGDNNIDNFIAGLEPTWVYLNEVNTLPDNVLSAFFRRCGRYPAPHDRPPTIPGQEPWFGVFGDFNATDETHWLYDACVANPIEGLKFIQQPSGFSPKAENLFHLRKIKHDYYQAKAKSMKSWEVKRMIENKWGYDRRGEPVYGEDYNDEIHCLETEYEPDPNFPIYIGIDGGLTPAAVFVQLINGTFIVFDELVTPKNTAWDVETFATKCLEFMRERYPGLRVEMFYPDPALNAKLVAGGQDLPPDARTWIFKFYVLTKWQFCIPEANDISSRLSSVRSRLKITNAFRLSPRVKVIRTGFISSYRLARDRSGEGTNTEIVKNSASHPHDALQYVSMGLGAPIYSEVSQNLNKGSQQSPFDNYDVEVIME